MNICVLFIILRNNSEIKLTQLEGFFFIIVWKRATLEQREVVEIRGWCVISTFNHHKVCAEGVMFIILQWRVFHIHKQLKIPTEYVEFCQLSTTDKKRLLQFRSVLLGNWLQVIPWHYSHFTKLITHHHDCFIQKRQVCQSSKCRLHLQSWRWTVGAKRPTSIKHVPVLRWALSTWDIWPHTPLDFFHRVCVCECMYVCMHVCMYHVCMYVRAAMNSYYYKRFYHQDRPQQCYRFVRGNWIPTKCALLLLLLLLLLYCAFFCCSFI
jgi:hypothetical protein